MKIVRWALLLALVTVLMASPAADTQEAPVAIRYFGQSFFLVTSGALRIAIDPFGDIGYPFPSGEGDVVLVTHEHRDHNNVGLIGGAPRILRGLTDGGREWAKIYERIAGTLFYTVPSFHDDQFGTARGLNAIFVMETGGLRIAHLGDHGQPFLSEGVLRAIGRVDILMIPVGGAPFTIGAREATHIVGQIHPRLAIPMHYRTAVRPEWPGTDERPFLEGKPNVRRLGSNLLIVARDQLPATTQIVVMNWR
ncbi:MAG: MBL fold metallo-hydrolase [Armatimonadetes bacterium]|nr:MBL fold metallo-hydrolase [Armatimonadota bacterium]